jgi:NADH:ubiquinone oxidoreductase subunit 2 (subunit N)
MFARCLIELDALLSIIMIIIYGLFCLRFTQINLSDVFLFCRIFPLLFVLGFFMDSSLNSMDWNHFIDLITTIDFLLALLLFFIMYNFQSFESMILLLFTFIAQYYMLHSIDLLTFYITLEAQNFAFLVLCGLPAKTIGNYVFSVEASIKYFIGSAFSSGVLLFWFSMIYLQTGVSMFSFSPKEQSILQATSTSLTNSTISIFLILCAMMFKLGAAPLHLWVVQIYNGVKRNLLLYIGTAPKLSLFGFWVNSFQTVWTDYSVLLFSIFSIALGAFGAYSQPTLRSLLAYSTVNEIGLLLSALETAGFNSLFQHLSIYIVSQILLWNLYDKRLFTILAVSLSGLPPLAGFFGKAFIFWHLGIVGTYGLLIFALFCAAISLVYYIRIIRLFWPVSAFRFFALRSAASNADAKPHKIFQLNYGSIYQSEQRIYLTSACVIILIILPIFVIKPFII